MKFSTFILAAFWQMIFQGAVEQAILVLEIIEKGHAEAVLSRR
jgi:hypothetical protein